MSRLAKKPIIIPEKTTVVFDAGTITVSAALGSLSRSINKNVSVDVADGQIVVSAKDTVAAGAMLGTTAAHIRNMVVGVNKAYEKKLIIEGIGYKAEVKGETVVFNLGFSHQIVLDIPKGVKVVVAKNEITISGIDKDVIGLFTASIRALKKPEPYKGKGIMYAGEVIRRKQGKKAV